MTTLTDHLADMRGHRVKLQPDIHAEDANCHRPDLSMWPCGDDGAAHIALSIGSMWGAPARFVELTPAQARELAAKLTDMANVVDAAVKQWG